MHRQGPPRQTGPLTPAQQREHAKRRRTPAVPDALPDGKTIKAYAPTVSSRDKPNTAAKRRLAFRSKQGGGVVSVPLDDINGAIELVADLGWLAIEEEARKPLGEALGALLNDLIGWANSMRDEHRQAWTDFLPNPMFNRAHDAQIPDSDSPDPRVHPPPSRR